MLQILDIRYLKAIHTNFGTNYDLLFGKSVFAKHLDIYIGEIFTTRLLQFLCTFTFSFQLLP